VLTTVVAFLVVLTVVVFVHELGHYLVARWAGVRVEVFSIGFGPELVGFNDRHGTRWKISAVPLGGFVKFFGDEDASSATASDRELTEAEKAVSFHHKSVWRRIAVVFAGPASNVIFAIAIFAAVFAFVGRMETPPVVSDVVPDSAAAEAGLQVGDRIVLVNGRAVDSFEELQRLIPLTNGASITLTVERGEETLQLSATPRFREIEDSLGETRRQAVLGVTAVIDPQARERLGPVDAVWQGVEQSWTVVETTAVAVGQMIAGTRGVEDLGGPVRIAQMSGQVAELGLVSLILFAAFLSVNLGLINLLPIPVLDGGHLVFYALEAVRGKPVSERAQDYAFRFGLVVIVGLMVFVTSNDIVRLLSG
jgi:regulator of sigma E protease